MTAEDATATTPCATCGGTGEVKGGRISAGGPIYTPMYPCPDCGVETPEAAVISDEQLMTAAWVVMDVVTETMPDQWEDRIRFFWDPRAVIVRLLAQGWTPPGGTE